VNVAEDRRNIAESRSLVAALSALAVTVQRRRTVDDVLEAAGRGALALGMRFGAFQIDGDELILRYLATAPKRYAAIEARIGRAIRGLSAPVAACELVRTVVTGRKILFRHDLDLFDTFLRVAAGYDPTALDRRPDTAGVTTGVLVPLFVRDAPWGLIAVYSSRLLRADADAVALFATHVGSALEVAESLEELARTQGELVERERLAALGELAAVVAHEVRNPLGVLFNAIGSLRGIVDAGAPPDKLGDARTCVSIAAEEAARLNDIVSDLLEFARPYHATLARCSIEAIVREIGSRDPRVDVSIAAPLPLVEIARRASAGDADASALLAARLDVLGRALATVVDVLDPDVVVLGGGVSNLAAFSAPGAAEAAVARWVFNDELATRIVPNELGDSAGVLGAALLPG
jgi:signal transduction histidine kinase